MQDFITTKDAFHFSKFSKPLRTLVKQSCFSENGCLTKQLRRQFSIPHHLLLHHTKTSIEDPLMSCKDNNMDSMHTSPSSVKMESAFRGSKCLISKLFKWFSTVSWTCTGSTPVQKEQKTWQMQSSQTWQQNFQIFNNVLL